MVDKDNKYSYWVFTISLTKKGQTLPGGQTLCQVLSRLTEKYHFQLEKATTLHYQGCCKTRIRKRQSTLLNEFVAELDLPREMITIDCMMGTWEQAKMYCSKSETGTGEMYSNEVIYRGADIEVLDNKAGRYPWQQSIIDKIIDEDTSGIKAADDRTIIWIHDPQGGNGKSKLVKWCCARYDNIIKISFGTSNQLRSAIISAGRKLVYFVDIPRTLGSDDSMSTLVSSIEDLL